DGLSLSSRLHGHNGLSSWCVCSGMVRLQWKDKMIWGTARSRYPLGNVGGSAYRCRLEAERVYSKERGSYKYSAVFTWTITRPGEDTAILDSTGDVFALFAKDSQALLDAGLGRALRAIVILHGPAAPGGNVGGRAMVDQAAKEQTAAWLQRHRHCALVVHVGIADLPV